MVEIIIAPIVDKISTIAKSHRRLENSKKFIPKKPKIIGEIYLKAISKNNCFFCLKTL